ncbi:MAG TPA: phenylalanine--tRNA ligase beta subunit-related protein [Thermomicrobiales bacterium]|jgi:DNA/RNA-binding domain of Phe-tRNA-synthetase-like protein|nr:phenylalanine--tRNA ligase beta subunit-related protein [Thermomicrobiales bacterium]
MLTFAIHPDIFERLPGMRVVAVVATGIDNTVPRPEVERRWREVWAATPERVAGLGNAGSHHRVAPWRTRMTAIGVSPKKYPVAIESILRRAMKGGDPFIINPLVDWYNSESLANVLPAGAFDAGELASMGGDLELRLTREGDRFHVLGAEASEPVGPGEIGYATGQTILTRHLAWRQSVEAMVTPATTSVIVMSETLYAIERAEPGTAEAMRRSITDGLGEAFGVQPAGTIVTQEQPRVTWDLSGAARIVEA